MVMGNKNLPIKLIIGLILVIVSLVVYFYNLSAVYSIEHSVSSIKELEENADLAFLKLIGKIIIIVFAVSLAYTGLIIKKIKES